LISIISKKYCNWIFRSRRWWRWSNAWNRNRSIRKL